MEGLQGRGTLEGQVEAGTVTVPCLPWPQALSLHPRRTLVTSRAGGGFPASTHSAHLAPPTFFTLGLFQGQRAFPKRNEAQALALRTSCPWPSLSEASGWNAESRTFFHGSQARQPKAQHQLG